VGAYKEIVDPAGSGVATGYASRATTYPESQASVSLILVVPMYDHMSNSTSSNQSALKLNRIIPPL
jgi:hypothetical protein